jgi:hypothetical protein
VGERRKERNKYRDKRKSKRERYRNIVTCINYKGRKQRKKTNKKRNTEVKKDGRREK